METRFHIEPIETLKKCTRTRRGFVKVFRKTNENLPLHIDLKNRYGVMCAEIEQYLEQIYNFEVRKDDVWVITSIKGGTTWMLEMVWMLVNNLDYETSLKVDQSERCRYLENIIMHPSYNSIEEASNMKSPRVIKTHLPIHILPKGLWTVRPKIVYVTRDPKDTIVSYCHFYNKLGATTGSMKDFVNEMVNDRTFYSPFWPQVAEFWSLRDESYIYFTSYERMKKDLRSEILKVGTFLEKALSNGELDKLVEHLTFDKMKSNPSCNYAKLVIEVQQITGIEENPVGVFLRKGEIGSHKEELSENLIQILNDWTQRSTKPYGISPDEVLYS